MPNATPPTRAFGSVRVRITVLSMVVFAIIGYLMKKNDFPMAPLILALVLGDLFESNWRRSLLAAQGSYDIFVGSTVSLIIIGIILIALCGPYIWRTVRRQALAPMT